MTDNNEIDPLLKMIEDEMLSKATRVKDYIWILDGFEMGMALRKIIETRYFVNNLIGILDLPIKK